MSHVVLKDLAVARPNDNINFTTVHLSTNSKVCAAVAYTAAKLTHTVQYSKNSSSIYSQLNQSYSSDYSDNDVQSNVT